MGVGQNLFKEIDSGITSAKVIIACCSNNYGASENCRREVNLSVNRRKVILPVWVAPVDPWPPYGDMGPLLAGKLYIDLSTEENKLKNQDQLRNAVVQLCN